MAPISAGVLFSVLISLLSVSVGSLPSNDFSLKTQVSLNSNSTYYTVPIHLPLSGNSSFLFSVSSSVPLSSLSPSISVCFTEYFYPYLGVWDWSEQTCDIFFTMTTSNSTTTSGTFVDPAPGIYFATLFVPLHAGSSGELEVEISGIQCNRTFGIGCQTQEQVLEIGVDYNITLSSSSEMFVGSFYLSSGVNQLLFKAALSSSSASLPSSSSDSTSTMSLTKRRRRRNTEGYIFALRYENAFMDKRERDVYAIVLKSNSTSNSLAIPVPRPGKWFLSILSGTAGGVYFRSAASVNARFQIQTTGCRLNNTKGPDCQSIQMLKQQSLHKLQTNASVTYLAFSYRDFFNESSNHTNNFSVFLSYTDLSPNAPRVWLRYAQVPSELSFDAISVGNSSVSNLTITFPSQRNETGNDLFYIAVAKGAKEMILWYNEPCPNGCSGQGRCILSLNGYYKCKCNSGYESYDCTVESDRMSDLQVYLLLTAYMVGLVLGLGVIAFAFHRHEIREYLNKRKRANDKDPAASPLLADE